MGVGTRAVESCCIGRQVSDMIGGGLRHLSGGDTRGESQHGCRVGLPEEEDPKGSDLRTWKNGDAMY